MFAERLKQLRKSKGLTQVQFATEFNISAGTIAMWETNKRIPDTTMLMRIADYFGVSVDYLLGNNTASANNTVSVGQFQLDNVYFSLAKQAQEDGVNPEDIRLAIETIKAMRNKGGDQNK